MISISTQIWQKMDPTPVSWTITRRLITLQFINQHEITDYKDFNNTSQKRVWIVASAIVLIRPW